VCSLFPRRFGIANLKVDEETTETDMANVTIYTAPLCPYCRMAKQILSDKNATFDEIDVTTKPGLRAEMSDKAGGRQTVPQIWIGEQHVGGCDDLMALQRSGKLDALLGA
jgi:glutaredoxin 3